MRTLKQIVSIAENFLSEKHPTALVSFCAGSLVRGEGTASSDLDIVVIYPQLTAAYRSSFVVDGQAIETFVNDPQTLRYFFALDARAGSPALAQMIQEGIPLGENAEVKAQSFKEMARQHILKGPPKLESDEIDRTRYIITDLVDDLRSPRNRNSAIAIASRLYSSLADFALRSNQMWSGAGKQVLHALERNLPAVAAKFTSAFEQFYTNNNSQAIIDLASEILTPSGGYLFDGYTNQAPSNWRSTDVPDNAIISIHHGQVSIPTASEDAARKFYCGILGLFEIEKPEVLRKRGGLWLQVGVMQVHLGAEDGISREATRAHLAYQVPNLAAWKLHLAAHGIKVLEGEPIPGFQRCEFRDPFGNRIEFLEAMR